jgi:hypothetical protein
MAVSSSKIVGSNRQVKDSVPGLGRGRGIRGWRPTPERLRLGRIMENVSIGLVLTFSLTALGYVLALVGGVEVSWLRVAAQVAGGVSFLVAHLVPPVADAITGGRVRLGLWSVLLFWVALAVFVGMPHML